MRTKDMMYSNGDFSRVPTFLHAAAKTEKIAALFLDCARYGIRLNRSASLDMVAVDLVRQARLLTELALCECNGIRHPDGVGISAEEKAEIDASTIAAREHVRKDVAALFADSCVIEFNRDPRGAPIAIDVGGVTLYVEGI